MREFWGLSVHFRVKKIFEENLNGYNYPFSVLQELRDFRVRPGDALISPYLTRPSDIPLRHSHDESAVDTKLVLAHR